MFSCPFIKQEMYIVIIQTLLSYNIMENEEKKRNLVIGMYRKKRYNKMNVAYI